MKISIVFTVMNQFPLARLAIKSALDNLSADADAELLIIDNGSDTPFEYEGFQGHFVVATKNGARVHCEIIRHEKSIGVYPTFWDGSHSGDIIAFFHSDLIICENGWDSRVVDAFLKHPKLGLLGFIGSNEIDGSGGRGLGTISNFQGNTYPDESQLGHSWMGSAGAVHGKVNTGFTDAAVVDGCTMLFSRAALESIKQRDNFPPHHFYDKLLSCEVREHGYTMGVLGVACDHISGQTVNQEAKYHTMAEDWSRAHLPESSFKGNPPHWAWDATVYHEAERQWLTEYRDQKHLIPCRV